MPTLESLLKLHLRDPSLVRMNDRGVAQHLFRLFRVPSVKRRVVLTDPTACPPPPGLTPGRLYRRRRETDQQ